MCVRVCSKSNPPYFSTRTAGLVQILAPHLLGSNLAVTILLGGCFFSVQKSLQTAEQTLNIASVVLQLQERLYW